MSTCATRVQKFSLYLLFPESRQSLRPSEKQNRRHKVRSSSSTYPDL